MAYVQLDRKKLSHNYTYLNKLFQEHGISWAVVTKLFCGNMMFIEELVKLGAHELCDSRISNLKKIKKAHPEVETVYIKPPAKRSIKSIVEWADVSFNTEYQTLRWLSDEALRQDKVHKALIMIELGDLREGVMGNELVEFYARVFELPNIQIVGIGANLNCLNGVMPSTDKLIQLSLYKQLIEAHFGVQIPWVSGGTSVVIPLVTRQLIPGGVNHFRVGETLFFGVDLFEEGPMKGLEQDVLMLYTEIIEITEKPVVPTGELAPNPSGEIYEIDEDDFGKKTYRAILDIGLLDIQPEFLLPVDKEIKIIGTSSDMIIIDLGENPHPYKVGDLVSFRLKYMGALGVMNSNYIEKRIK
jgi:predicted amino acid racemase